MPEERKLIRRIKRIKDEYKLPRARSNLRIQHDSDWSSPEKLRLTSSAPGILNQCFESV